MAPQVNSPKHEDEGIRGERVHHRHQMPGQWTKDAGIPARTGRPH